jgi:hypothetical protein
LQKISLNDIIFIIMASEPNGDIPRLSLYGPDEVAASESVEELVAQSERTDSLISEVSEISYPYVGLFRDLTPQTEGLGFNRLRKIRSQEFTRERQLGSYVCSYEFKLLYNYLAGQYHLKEVDMSATSTAGTPFGLEMLIDRGTLERIKLSWDRDFPHPTALSRLANPKLADFLNKTYNHSHAWNNASLEFDAASNLGFHVRSSVAHAHYAFDSNSDAFTKALLEGTGTFENADTELSRTAGLHLLSDVLALIPT